MRFLYTFGVLCYGFIIRCAALFSTKAKAWIEGRKDFWNQLPTIDSENVVWFHCASLGEFDQGLPLMKKIKSEHPTTFLLVTFFSPSGFQHYHKREHPADFVCYLPLDTPKNASQFIRHFRPKTAFFVKYEFWGNYIESARNSGTMIYNVSGLFRPKHRFFKWYGSYFREVLGHFSYFFVQDERSKELLMSIRLQNVSVIGDTRFDRVIEHKKKAEDNQIIEDFRQGNDLVIIGSSWSIDETVVLPWVNSTEQKVLIAPHSIDEKHLTEIEQRCTRSTIRYTQWTSDTTAQVLILDTIGHLASAYKSGRIAYVGGGFTGSLHNILEPAVFGLPVLFGPKHERFPEAERFIKGGFGFAIQTTEEFETKLREIELNYQKISTQEARFVEENAGATDKIYAYLTANSVF